MYSGDDFPTFTNYLGKFLSAQWSRIRSSSSSSNSEKNVDRQLEEEYETLLKELDYLTAEKTCYLSFLNSNFPKSGSSDDLSTMLKKHSSEILRSYVAKHEKEIKDESFLKRQDLINYVTEIVISNKCNNKLCSCKPIRVSKEILTDNTLPKENRKETQTNSEAAPEKAVDVKPIITEQSNQTSSSHDLVDDTTVQTDDNPIQDATTSDRRMTASKTVSANCFAENLTDTSNRLCVPGNFELLLEEGETDQQFSTCSKAKDCSCHVYDVKAAQQRGLVLPSTDICVQKVLSAFDRKKNEEENSTKKKSGSSGGNETTDVASSADNKKKKATVKAEQKEEKRKQKEEKNKQKEEKNKQKEEKNKQKEEKNKQKEEKNKQKEEKRKSALNNNSSREKPERGRSGRTNCFGLGRKKSLCDEYCLGKEPADKSMQTILRTWDQNEDVDLSDENDRKSAQTSTRSEAETQVSAQSSTKGFTEPKKDQETSFMADREPNQNISGTWSKDDDIQEAKPSKAYNGPSADKDYGEMDNDNKNKELDNKERDNREKIKNNICNRCGRQKRECVNGCRNTFIIPYAANSSKAMPAQEVDSLRMFIKMQGRETNRRIDNIMSQLNNQKSEVRHLNDMCEKMMGNYYEMQSSKQPSNLSRDCHCSSKIHDNAKPCGCSVSNECKILQNNDTPTGRSNDTNTASNSSRNVDSIPLRRFGPINTAVSINRCDVGHVELGGTSVQASFTTKEHDYRDGDKQRKDRLNRSKKATKSHENVSMRQDNVQRVQSVETGDQSLPKEDSVSTLYKNDKTHYDKISIRENLLDGALVTGRGVPESTRKSSRIVIWLKKSWINIKHKTAEDCRNKEKKETEEQVWKRIFKYCEYKVKQAATEMWKAAKNVPMPF